MEKLLDLRNIIAAFFGITGVILLGVYFIGGNTQGYAYFFLNLYAGITYIIFSALMFLSNRWN